MSLSTKLSGGRIPSAGRFTNALYEGGDRDRDTQIDYVGVGLGNIAILS